MKTIAVVDDDVSIGNMLEEALAREGYAVSRAYSGSEALLLFEKRRFDLILLDLMLPGLPGEAVLPHVRDTPTIIISAKLDTQDKVSLLRAGAADYVSKPFDISELLARVDARLRDGAPERADTLTCGDIVLTESARSVGVGGTPVRLTRTEYAILRILMRNKGQAIAKSTLLERLGEDTPDCVESSLKVHVSNLRKKIREAGGGDAIEAVWGIGFRMNGK